MGAKKNQIYRDGELSVFNTIKYFLEIRNLKKVAIVGIVGAIVGVFVALTTPDSFTSTTKLLPVSSTSSSLDLGGAGLSSLAGFAGIDISSFSSEGDIITPKHYPAIVSSKEFKNILLTDTFQLPDKKITVLEYINEYHRSSLLGSIIKLPWTVLRWIKGSKEQSAEFDPLLVDEERLKIYEFLNENIQVELDDELGLIVIVVNLQDPYLSYSVCTYIKDYIIDYVESVTNANLRMKRAYLEKIFAEKKVDLKSIEGELANLYDKNRNISSKSLELLITNKQTDYDLIFSSVTEIQSEIHTTEMQLQKENRVIEVLDPPFIPLENSEPNRVLILVISVFLFSFIFLARLFIVRVSEELEDASS